MIHSIKRVFFILFLSSTFLGCSSLLQSKDPSAQGRLYEKATQVFKTKGCMKALPIYNEHQRLYPLSKYSQKVLFAQGFCLEKEGDYSQAAQLYRQSIEMTLGRHPRLTAEALVRVSYCYEALRQDALLIASLKDALRRKQHLSFQVLVSEIPVRLSAAYSREGNTLLAREYSHRAEVGLQEIIRLQKTKPSPEFFYRMGKMSNRNWQQENFSQNVKTLSYLQKYLLRAIEKGELPWAEKAFQELTQAYSLLWQNLSLNQSSLRKGDPQAIKRQKSKIQEQRALQLLEALRLLQKERLPKELEKGSWVSKLNSLMIDLEKKLRQMAFSPTGESWLTPEALRRNSLRKDIQLMNDSILFEVNGEDPNL